MSPSRPHDTSAPADRDEVLRTVSSVLLHELRAPIASGTMFLSALRDDLVPSEERPRVLDTAMASLERAHAMTDKLWRLTRTVLLEPEPTELDLVEVVDGMLGNELHALVNDREADVLVAELPSLVADARLVRDAVREVLRNALEHTGADGVPPRVAVSGGRDGDDVRLVVADDGPGLADEQLATVGRTGPESATTLGGLGLVLAAVAARRLDGALTAAAGAGGGLVVTLSLPAVAVEP